MGMPHQLQRKLEIKIVDFVVLTTYIRAHDWHENQWALVSMRDVIRLAAKRHSWRLEIAEELKNLGEDDE